jgi:hypothetical protein
MAAAIAALRKYFIITSFTNYVQITAILGVPLPNFLTDSPKRPHVPSPRENCSRVGRNFIPWVEAAGENPRKSNQQLMILSCAVCRPTGTGSSPPAAPLPYSGKT